MHTRATTAYDQQEEIRQNKCKNGILRYVAIGKTIIVMACSKVCRLIRFRQEKVISQSNHRDTSFSIHLALYNLCTTMQSHMGQIYGCYVFDMLTYVLVITPFKNKLP